MPKYILLTESALDHALVTNSFSRDSSLPQAVGGIRSLNIGNDIEGYRVPHENPAPYHVVVGVKWIDTLRSAGVGPIEIYQRIARVLKGLKSPPVHLPRQWLEYHHRNLLAFFALPRDIANLRWIVQLGGTDRFAYFDHLYSHDEEVDLSQFVPIDVTEKISDALKLLLSAEITAASDGAPEALAQEVDLHVIGSGSVVAGRLYEDWQRYLTPRQMDVQETDINTSIRIVGPAGSGKTLSLCMRALQISRDLDVVSRGKRILVATHSWAMAERIDGVLSVLNGGLGPNGITVFPLMSLLELHAGHIGQRRTEIIGDDSSDGRFKSLDIINAAVTKVDIDHLSAVSPHLVSGVIQRDDSNSRIDLIFNLYEEITGVISASGVAPDDSNAIQSYLSAVREDWMPPFNTLADRAFAINVYRLFIQSLIDRAAITADQFILDCIRVLETFTWRIKKETEGYDFIIVDELQLFDPQERSALELLGRSRRGVPFITAEDPSQGVFAALNNRRSTVDNAPVYLDTVHRFNNNIFAFINFLYQQFPLNAVPLKIGDKLDSSEGTPTLVRCSDDLRAIAAANETVRKLSVTAKGDERICIVTLGDVDSLLIDELQKSGLVITRLESFDDVEQLSYRRKSIVISPWQFIGGTQFAHVVVLALGMGEQASQFWRLREKI